jgi:thymidine kinase
MINVIYGAKGSGKTQKIIDKANARANLSKGCVLYLTDRAEHSDGVDNSIRFIDVKTYGITDENQALYFIKGLLASNYDVTDVFIDGLAKFIGKEVSELEKIFEQLDLISCDTDVAFTLTVSAEEVPLFMRKYI